MLHVPRQLQPGDVSPAATAAGRISERRSPQLGIIKVLMAVDWTVAPGCIRLLNLQRHWAWPPALSPDGSDGSQYCSCPYGTLPNVVMPLIHLRPKGPSQGIPGASLQQGQRPLLVPRGHKPQSVRIAPAGLHQSRHLVSYVLGPASSWAADPDCGPAMTQQQRCGVGAAQFLFLVPV